MSRPKICVTTPEYPPLQWGGLARTVFKVCRHAATMGFEVHVARFTVSDRTTVLLDENVSEYESDGILVHDIVLGRESFHDGSRSLWDCPHTLTLRMMYQSLEMLHRRERFDLFHSFFLYPVGYITGLMAKRMSIPSVVTIVGNDIKKYIFSPEKVALCKSGLDNADYVVALSRDMIEMADALTPIAEKSRVVHNSVEIPDRSWKPCDNESGPPVIGCAGIFKYAKGLPYLTKAVAALKSRRKCVLELRGELREAERPVYQEMLDRTGAHDLVRLEAPLPHEQMSLWLSSLDAFVLPSVSEGCPNILMEALAAGVPCIATRTGAAEDLIEDRVSGLLVPCGDSDSLSRALLEVIDDSSRAASMGAAGRERMRAFGTDKERSAWESVYGQLMELHNGI